TGGTGGTDGTGGTGGTDGTGGTGGTDGTGGTGGVDGTGGTEGTGNTEQNQGTDEAPAGRDETTGRAFVPDAPAVSETETEYHGESGVPTDTEV
ncbi:MAG: esterase, partial [Oscillibacter sp.]|nr:esterase [Oscillibacter sp.]